MLKASLFLKCLSRFLADFIGQPCRRLLLRKPLKVCAKFFIEPMELTTIFAPW